MQQIPPLQLPAQQSEEVVHFPPKSWQQRRVLKAQIAPLQQSAETEQEACVERQHFPFAVQAPPQHSKAELQVLPPELQQTPLVQVPPQQSAVELQELPAALQQRPLVQLAPLQQSAALPQLPERLLQQRPPEQTPLQHCEPVEQLVDGPEQQRPLAHWPPLQHWKEEVQALPLLAQHCPALQVVPGQQSVAEAQAVLVAPHPHDAPLHWPEQQSAPVAQPPDFVTQQDPLTQDAPAQQGEAPLQLSPGAPQVEVQLPPEQLPEQQSEKVAQDCPRGLQERQVPSWQVSPGQQAPPAPQVTPSPGQLVHWPPTQLPLQHSLKERQEAPPWPQ